MRRIDRSWQVPVIQVSGTFVFASEEGKSTDNIPRARFGCNLGGGPDAGIVFCDFDSTGRVSTLRVGGPFLAGRLTNDTGVFCCTQVKTDKQYT